MSFIGKVRGPSPALVVACIALAVALSGVGYAAVALPRNSVGPAQLKKNAVTSVKVKNRSLRAVDFARGQLPAGPVGPVGPVGPQGPEGPSNPNADTLDGLDSSAFLPVGALDAFHSSAVLPAAPSPTAGIQLFSASVTLQRPGRLFVLGYINGTVSCSAAGSCSTTYALFVDGVAVPGSQRPLSAAASSTSGLTRMTLAGLTGQLAAGAHTISMRSSGGTNVSSESWSERTLSAIAVG